MKTCLTFVVSFPFAFSCIRLCTFTLNESGVNMCNGCVKEEFPERDSTCLDNGSYMLNFCGCAECGQKTGIIISNRQTTEDELGEEETVTYQHLCKDCNHVVANHQHLFRVEDDYQVYEMYCSLCGTGEDQRSIMPCDPRGPKD